MDFLSAAEGLDTKAQNRGLLQAVDDYCADAELGKMSVRPTVSRFTAIVMSNCKPVKRLPYRCWLKSYRNWAKRFPAIFG